MTLAISLLSAFVFGLISTLAVRTLALNFSFVSQPNPIVVQHTKPIALLGGVGIWMGVLFTVFFLNYLEVMAIPHGLKLFLPATMFLALGAMDDQWEFPPLAKFTAQLIIAIIAVFLNQEIALTGVTLLDTLLFVAWLLVIVNAFNLVDVCDGLAGGLGIVALLFVAVLVSNGNLNWILVAGATLGFLVFNSPPASIFMGDAGSHFLGFTVAMASLDLVQNAESGSFGVLQALLIVAVPLFELVFLIFVRVKKGIPWWRGSPDHFSLRMQSAGLSKWSTIAIAIGIACILGFIAIAVDYTSRPVTSLLCLATVLGLILCSHLLLKIENN